MNTFLELGARVTAHYNSSIGQLASLDNVISIQADVRDEEQVHQLFTEAARRNGQPVSILIVNHGIWPSNPLTFINAYWH